MAHGLITYASIKDNAVQRQLLITEMIEETYKTGSLLDPSIVKVINVRDIHVKIPIMGTIPVVEDLDELETTGIQSAGYDSYSFDLKKDRIKIAVSDEMRLEENGEYLFEMQRSSGMRALDASGDKKVATQLADNPQTVTWDISEENALVTAISAAVGDVAPYSVSGLAMNPATYTKALGLFESRTVAGITTLPDGTLNGNVFGLPQAKIVLSDNLAVNKMYAVSNLVPGVIWVQGAVKPRMADDMNLGAEVIQYDVWRGAFGGLVKTSTDKNKGVVEITLG